MKTPSSVVVALSGGVDSSVAAALLKEKGWEVTGLHLLLPGPSPCAQERVASVRRVAEHLRIALDFVNLEETFRVKVVEPFVDLYLRGLTPNPCVLCNEVVKFEHLVHFAREQGIPYVATGHYAILKGGEGTVQLCRGLDRKKEQSYFLHRLRQEQLAKTLFPLGTLSKEETRGLARKTGLPTRSERESQEICFLPQDDYRAFLESCKGDTIRKAGDILERDGRKVGNHMGAYRFTIGQRQGLGIASNRPYYVMEIRGGANQIVVGRKEDLYSQRVEAEGVRWISGGPPAGTESLSAQVRYRHPAAKGRLRILSSEEIAFEFQEPQWAITPGQALAIYAGERVLGGGWMRKGARRTA